jgi:hypothetical protein
LAPGREDIILWMRRLDAALRVARRALEPRQCNRYREVTQTLW